MAATCYSNKHTDAHIQAYTYTHTHIHTHTPERHIHIERIKTVGLLDKLQYTFILTMRRSSFYCASSL